MNPQLKANRRSLNTYIVGYVLSLFLTITAYLLVRGHVSTKWVLVGLVVGLALVQFIVQLLFFLKLGTETRPRWKLLVFGFMIMVVLILVFGSLWIMNNLNYRMTPQQIQNYLQDQDGGI